MKIKRFEDMKARQEARNSAKMTYKAISKNKNFYKDFKLKEQIQGATVSVMSNIAEGFARGSDRDS